MKTWVLVGLILALLGLGAPARADVLPGWTPQPGCHLRGKAEFRDYWYAVRTADRGALYAVCAPTPWGPR